MQTMSEAVRAGEQGSLLAATHANKVEDSWTVKASVLFVDYARDIAAGQPFLVEQAREWAEKQGLNPPPDNRAWGFVTRSMLKAGHIVFAGYAPAKSSRGSPKTLWRYW